MNKSVPWLVKKIFILKCEQEIVIRAILNDWINLAVASE